MNVVILGATSAIAQEVARCFAADGAAFFLVARDEAKCAIVAADLLTRGAKHAETFIADLVDGERHAEIAAAAGRALVSIDVVLIAHGVLPDQQLIDRDAAAQVDAFNINATSFISLAAHFANLLERNGNGTLALIGSVAGDRGRRSNYVYGAAKAAVHAYSEGLRARIGPAVRVVLVKPGWIDTPMTSGLRKNPLFASAEAAGRSIHDAIIHHRDVVYVPWFWRWISFAVRLLPARFVRF